MNEFVSWCRHLLVSFLFHALTSLHPPSFHRNDFSTCKSSSQEKCDVVENSAYGVTVQGSAGDRLEPDYNMENNPMRSLSNDRHSHKTQTTAPAVPVYETVDSVAV